MNYLAHAYLSFGDPDILAGNMISDFVKGKKKYEYPDRIQMGITLHRKIDEYTDYTSCYATSQTISEKNSRTLCRRFCGYRL